MTTRALITVRGLAPLLLVLAMSGSAAAQPSRPRIVGRVSYSFFALSDLKELQKEFQAQLTDAGIPGKITDAFPPFVGFEAGLLVPVEESPEVDVLVGGSVEYASTGGRVHYRDYSGESIADQKAHYIAFGAAGERTMHLTPSTDLGLRLSVKLLVSRLNNTFTFRVGDQTEISRPNFHSTSVGIEPAVMPTFPLLGFRAGVSVSYLLALPTSLEYDNLSNAFLVNGRGDKVSIDWGGFRFGIVASF
jgi:hypothetical protein